MGTYKINLGQGARYETKGVTFGKPVNYSLDRALASDPTVQTVMASDVIQNGTLKLNDLHKSGFDVNASYNENGYTTKVVVKGVNHVNNVKKVFDIVASCNEEVIVSYRDTLDLESARLAKKTKKPLWLLSFEGGDVILERQF